MPREIPDTLLRRRSPRLVIDTPVRIEWPEGSVEGRGADVSENSMLVASEELPPVGTEVTLHCIDDHGRAVVVRGFVARHQDGGELKPRGMVVTEHADSAEARRLAAGDEPDADDEYIPDYGAAYLATRRKRQEPDLPVALPPVDTEAAMAEAAEEEREADDSGDAPSDEER